MASVATTRVPPSRVLLVASFGAFLAFLDATIVNVAFPSIRESFADTTIDELSWVLNAYNIVFAASLILCGRLTDLVGRRRSFVAGVAVFTIASAACGLAPSVEFLILARVVQAFGAAMLVPASLALVIAAFPAERRAHAIGVWGASAAVAAGVGPPIGGALVQLGGWRWAFLVNLPFGLVAVWAARHELVESRAPGRRVMPDLVGAALLVVSLALLNLGIIKGGDWGWTSPEVIGSFVGAALALGLFVLSSRRHRAPMLDPTLLRLRSFDLGSVATVAAGFGFYAYLLTNVLWLQYVWGYDVLKAGLALVPGAVVAALVASRLGPLAERYGYRVFVVPGAVVWAAAYLWYHQRVGLEPAFWAEWMPGQVLSGIGVGCRRCRCWGAPRWRRSREVATPRHPRWRRAHASSGASSASRSWWSSSATPHRPRWSTRCTRAGCSRSSRSSSSRCSPSPWGRSTPPSRTRTSSTSGRPWSSRRTHPPTGPFPRPWAVPTSSTCPCSRCSRRSPTRRCTVSSAPPGSSTCRPARC